MWAQFQAVQKAETLAFRLHECDMISPAPFHFVLRNI